MAGAAEDRSELCTWPRVVRPNRRQRLLGQGAGAVLLAMGLALVGVALSWRPEPAADVLSVVLAVTGLGFALGGAYCIAWIRSKRAVLFEDAIELVDLGVGRRRLRRDEVRGLRIIPRQHGFQRLVFELREAGRKPVKTDLHCERDAALDDWLAAIPDLDALDRRRAKAKLLRRTELGQTEEERRRALARARRVARAATVLSAGTMAWALLYPRPYEAAVATLAAIPLATVALLLAGRGLYAISDARNEIRPSLMVPLFGPGLFLTVRAIFDLHVIDWEPSLVWTALVTLALTVLVMVGEPWGPAQEGEVTVDSDLYEAVEVGGEVCVALQPGALGVRWFLVGRCDE